MEFWGVEVKSGEPFKVSPGEGMLLHLSQASLGEMKKNKPNESVYLSLEIDGKKLMLGTLFSEKMPQMQLDLVFEKEFELSHNWKNGSVFFHGYKADNPYQGGDSSEEESDDSDSEEDIPLPVANGKPEAKPIQEKPVATEKANASKEKKGKQKVQIVEPPKVEDSDSSDEMSGDEDDSEDDDSDDSDASVEDTPKKPEPSKKRPAESSSKTPVTEKKAKSTPQKTDGKKASGHVATPYPAKGKTPANKTDQQTPKSAGQHACGSCNKSFGSDKALESHSKAKHGEAK